MMMVDEARFYAEIRSTLFAGKITPTQFRGIQNILIGAAKLGVQDRRHIAYILATAYHETVHLMVPVRETLSPTDDIAIGKLNAAYAAGKLPQVKEPYWRKDQEGKSWFGRGLVQLTFKRNYERMSSLTGYDLVGNPSLALDPVISVAILIRGMQFGSFTNRKLQDYFNAKTWDWVGARRIINGLDRAAQIGQVGEKFYYALIGVSIEQITA